jgi:hypothetical protein
MRFKMPLRKTGKIIPSYKQGFGTYGESNDPGLWKNIIGAWTPFLGPTGDTLRDHSRKLNHGSITSATWASGGLVFNGIDGLVDLPNVSSLRPTGSFTVSATINTDGSPGVQTIFASYSENPNVAGIAFQLNSSERLRGLIGNNSGSFALVVGSVVISGRTDVILRYDGSTISVWVDGELDTSAAWTNGAAYTGDNRILIGAQSTNGVTLINEFAGIIESVILQNHAPKATEIKEFDPHEMFRRPSPVKYLSPVAAAAPFFFLHKQNPGIREGARFGLR